MAPTEKPKRGKKVKVTPGQSYTTEDREEEEESWSVATKLAPLYAKGGYVVAVYND
jgi:hypothetical protein